MKTQSSRSRSALFSGAMFVLGVCVASANAESIPDIGQDFDSTNSDVASSSSEPQPFLNIIAGGTQIIAYGFHYEEGTQNKGKVPEHNIDICQEENEDLQSAIARLGVTTELRTREIAASASEFINYIESYLGTSLCLKEEQECDCTTNYKDKDATEAECNKLSSSCKIGTNGATGICHAKPEIPEKNASCVCPANNAPGTQGDFRKRSDGQIARIGANGRPGQWSSMGSQTTIDPDVRKKLKGSKVYACPGVSSACVDPKDCQKENKPCAVDVGLREGKPTPTEIACAFTPHVDRVINKGCHCVNE